MKAATKKTLNYHWVASGLASSLSRFIPFPLVDGFVDTSAKRYAIDRTLNFHGRSFKTTDLKALYQDSTNVPGMVLAKFKQLALFPVRKVAKLVSASTGMPKDFAETYFLARAIDICLENGLLPDSASSEARNKDALKIRKAFDSAFENIDDNLFHNIATVVKREYSEMKPEVSSALAKIIGRSTSGLGGSKKGKKEKSFSLESKEDLESDVGFSALLTSFDENFQDELDKLNLSSEG